MLRDGERAALQFSGGKDSAALLYRARPWLDRITVFFADTGAVYPHVRDFVEQTCLKLGARLEVVSPPRHVKEHIDAAGLPSDLVPVESTLEMQPMLRERKPQLVQSYIACCGAMIWQPLERAIREAGFSVVLRGSKRPDARVGVGPSHWERGVEYRSPLWDWSDERVMAYLRREGVRLPTHYAHIPDSLDCWLCTAHLAHHGIAKLRWTREHYPALWPELQRRFARLAATLDAERAAISSALAFPGEPS